jgi:hypothetical protein
MKFQKPSGEKNQKETEQSRFCELNQRSHGPMKANFRTEQSQSGTRPGAGLGET